MRRLSCAAEKKTEEECFGGAVEVELGKTTAYSGMKEDFKTSGASVDITTESVDAETDSQTISVTSIPSDSLADTGSAGFNKVDGRRLGSGGNCKQ